MTAGTSPASSAASPTSIGHQHEGSAMSTSDLMMPRLIGGYYPCATVFQFNAVSAVPCHVCLATLSQ
jgi:hypothetical protein